MPWIRGIMESHGWAAILFWIVLTGLVLAGVAYVYGKTKKALEERRY